MEFETVLRRRRMIRDFTDDPIDPLIVDGLCDLARRAPSAGNSQGVEFLVLDRPESTRRYWDTTLTEPRRSGFRWKGLLRAPVLVITTVSSGAYLQRYSEPDKARTGLGGSAADWPVPYWWVDAGAAIQQLLLGVVDRGLGACLFGLFEHERAVAETFGVPEDRRLVATIAMGHPRPDEPGRSAKRRRKDLDEVLHRNMWSS